MKNTLILGAGKFHQKKDNHLTVDRIPFDCIDVVYDLNDIPWTFANDDTFIHVSCLHVVEHLNSLVDFMNQCHRILTRGGSLYIETPLAGGDVDLTHSDPTHVRCYRVHTWINYFTPEGIENFGYTDKPWAILFQKVEHSIIKIHLTPIK